MALLWHEKVYVLLLDRNNYVLKKIIVSVGDEREALVPVKKVFREAIRKDAEYIIIAHNHPSGDPTPSTQDKAITSRLVYAGQIIGIKVVDHVIITDTSYISMREEAYM